MHDPTTTPATRDGVALLMALVLAGIVLVFVNPLVDVARGYNRDVAVTTTAIFASVRGATSVMSMARDADFSAGAVVGSVTASPGQVLQPVIATLERMADLLFALAIVSGVLAVSLPVVGTLGAVALALGAAGMLVLRPWRAAPEGLKRVATTLLFIGLVGSVVLPGAYLTAFVVGDKVTADAWTRAADVFHQQAQAVEAADPATAVPLTEVPPPSATAEPGMFDWFTDAIEGTSEAIGGALTATQQFAGWAGAQVAANAQVVTDGVASAGELFGASVDIGVAYLVKLVVLPALLLGAAIWVLRSGFGREPVVRRIEVVERAALPRREPEV
ncbi:MAG: hypothetical protein ACO1OG_10545 [Devosia sp.]